MGQEVNYFGKKIPLIGKFDVVIAGGGAAGSAAGIECAGAGLETLIIDKFGLMGGSAVNSLVVPMMPSYVDHLEVLNRVEKKLKENGNTTRDDYTTMIWFSPQQLSRAFEELYTKDGGRVLFDSTLVDVIKEGDAIRYLVVATLNGLSAIAADLFVDASGDAALSRFAGVPCDHGDENGNNQVSSLRFLIGGIDIEKYRDYVLSLGDEFSPLIKGYFFESAMVRDRGFKLEPIFREGIEEGMLEEEDLRYYQLFTVPDEPGVAAMNCPHIASLKDNTDAMARSRAMIEGHERIRRLCNFLKKKMPGFENSYLLQTAELLGVRESWRIRGQYILTEEDYTSQARFEDGLVKGDWYIDVHSSSKSLYHQNTYKHGDYYEIPYRSMVTDEISNLVVAGRCISATFLMQASVRIIPTCIDMGEMAGRACIESKKQQLPLNRLNGKDFKQI